MSESQAQGPTKVVIFSGAYDTGGQGYRIKLAFDRYQPDFSVRSVHTLESYAAFPYDLRKGHPDVKGLIEAADILHMCNGLEDLAFLRPERPRGLVVHHRGTKFREYHRRLTEASEAEGAVQIASTLDLTLLEPNVHWLPSPYEVHELAAMRYHWGIKVPPYRPIRIAHAPTNREVKSTKAVLAAIQELNNRGITAELDLIEKKPWSEVLKRKAKADIYVDQLVLGYGNNAIEAWSMGVPVVAGTTSSSTYAAMMHEWGGLPFYAATEGDLADRLAELATDPTLRSHWGEKGKDHVLRYHDAKGVSHRLASIYEAALRKASPNEPESEVSYGFI